MKLTIPTDLKEITLSQYRRYQKVIEDNPNDDVFVCIQTINNEEQIELMLSVMYRKITKKASVFYEIEPYNPDIDLSEKFKNVPMHIVKGAQVFFWNLFNELLQNTLSSIPKIAKAEGVDLEAVFQSVGGGITLLSESQESIKSELKMWEEKIFTNHSRYYLT